MMLRCALLLVQATVLQSGSGGLFLGVATAANISYAGGKNTTYIQANGAANGVATVADVQYTTAGALCSTSPLCLTSSQQCL